MKSKTDTDLSRRRILVSATGLAAAGALGVHAAPAEKPPSANAIHPRKLNACAEATHSCQEKGAAAHALAGKQLAQGDTRMASCNYSCINMLAVTKALHTVSMHGTADPQIIKELAAASHLACLECEAACNEFDNPVYQSCAESCRRTAEHSKAIAES